MNPPPIRPGTGDHFIEEAVLPTVGHTKESRRQYERARYARLKVRREAGRQELAALIAAAAVPKVPTHHETWVARKRKERTLGLDCELNLVERQQYREQLEDL